MMFLVINMAFGDKYSEKVSETELEKCYLFLKGLFWNWAENVDHTFGNGTLQSVISLDISTTAYSRKVLQFQVFTDFSYSTYGRKRNISVTSLRKVNLGNSLLAIVPVNSMWITLRNFFMDTDLKKFFNFLHLQQSWGSRKENAKGSFIASFLCLFIHKRWYFQVQKSWRAWWIISEGKGKIYFDPSQMW